MQSGPAMTFGEAITPWLALAAVLIPLIYIERWLHRHLYGVGWLMSRGNPRTATALYYIVLFPGVFVHEFTQYLVAGALNVRIKKDVNWPEAQNDGTLRLDFVRIQKAHWYQAAIIGAAPMFVGTALVWVISNHVLKLTQLLDAFSEHDIRLVGTAIENLAQTPDSYIWLYLIFAISNAMFPTPADRQGWPLFIGVFSALMIMLVILGVNPDVLLDWYGQNIASGVELMTTAFAAVLVVALFSIFVIGFSEEILERFTRRKFDYTRNRTRTGTRRRSGREPGSADPIPFDAPLPSIYSIHLPVPDPAKRSMLPPRKNAPVPTSITSDKAAPHTPSPMRGLAPALDEPARVPASLSDRTPAAGAASFGREGAPASPPREPPGPTAKPARAAQSMASDAPAQDMPSFRREESRATQSREQLDPTMKPPRPDRPGEPGVMATGDVYGTQRFPPTGSRGTPAPSSELRRPGAPSESEPSSSRPELASGIPTRMRPGEHRPHASGPPDRRLSPFAPPADDEDEDFDVDNEELDEEDLDDMDDIELVDFDDI